LPQRGKISLGSACVARQYRYEQDTMPAPCLHAPLEISPSHPLTLSYPKCTFPIRLETVSALEWKQLSISIALTRSYLIYSFLSALQQDLQNFLHNNKPTANTIITTRAIFISPPFLQLYHFPSKIIMGTVLFSKDRPLNCYSSA